MSRSEPTSAEIGHRKDLKMISFRITTCGIVCLRASTRSACHSRGWLLSVCRNAAVAGLSSPSEQTSAIAVPAPTVAISALRTLRRPLTSSPLNARRLRHARIGRLREPSWLLQSKRRSGPRSLGKQTKAIAAQQRQDQGRAGGRREEGGRGEGRPRASDRESRLPAGRHRSQGDRPADPEEQVWIRLQSVRLLQQHHHAREHVGHERDQPQLGGVRHPAGSARLEDGERSAATGGPTRRPRSSGPSST